MPTYTLNHVHHEAADVAAAVHFYRRVFDAAAGEPFQRGGATWCTVRLGDLQLTVTDRECAAMDLGRYQGYDHIALDTDDFNATLERIRAAGVHIWRGPLSPDGGGPRVVFIDGPDRVKIELMEKR